MWETAKIFHTIELDTKKLKRRYFQEKKRKKLNWRKNESKSLRVCVSIVWWVLVTIFVSNRDHGHDIYRDSQYTSSDRLVTDFYKNKKNWSWLFVNGHDWSWLVWFGLWNCWIAIQFGGLDCKSKLDLHFSPTK
jgi:hypothetical protein